MAKVSSELLHEAFIKPIRFALLLDDRFPTFPMLADKQFDPQLDNARAKALFELCRAQGWLCDVGNRPVVAEKFETDNHLHQSDLLILDYNLDPNDQNDPTAALGIIQKLAASDHFNLVIVYTDSDSRNVTRDIAFSLGAGSELAPNNAAAVIAAIDDLDEEESRRLDESFNQTIIDDYLRDQIGQSGGPFRADLVKAGIDRRIQADALIEWTRRRLKRKIKPEILARRRPERPVHASLAQAAQTFWVTQDNVFVAVVNKLQHEPGVLIERLLEAIDDWDPSPLLVMMMQARSALEKAGTIADQKILETPRLRAGWLLRILLGKSDEDRRDNIAELYGRLFERLAMSVEPSIVDFGARLIQPEPAVDPVDTARSLASAVHNMGASSIYHALNEHLCSDACPDGGMTTGVVFRGKRSGKEQYWVCVTPACDLVKGQNTSGWDGELNPTRPVAVARLRAIKRPDAVSKVLQTSTIGRHIFLFCGDTAMAFEVIEENSRQMTLETLFMEDGGAIKDGKASGHVIDMGSDGKPVVTDLTFDVVAKLRPDYANRLLTQSGTQRARIGVDFFNLPEVVQL